MDANLVITLIIFFFACIYLYKLILSSVNSVKNKENLLIRKRIELLEEENKRRYILLEKVAELLKTSQFFEPIGSWRGETIFNYIFNDQKLYEFDDFIPQTNQNIIIEEDRLCFNQLSYKKSTKSFNSINAEINEK